MNDTIWNELKKAYTLKQREMEDLQKIRTDTAEIACETYEIAEIGNPFLMEMQAMQGAMKMETCVITPFAKDLSFCNIDIVQVTDDDTCLFEMYESSLQEEDLSLFAGLPERYRELPDYDGGSHWYDEFRLPSSLGKKGKQIRKQGEEMLRECLAAYLETLKKAPACDPEAKKAEVRKYADRLISEGGMAVDGLSRMIGKEKCMELIRKYMYDI